MTLGWLARNPAVVALLALNAVAVATAVDYWLCNRYGWRLDLRESLVGYGAGLIGSGLAIWILGIFPAALLATVAIAITGAALYLFEDAPEDGGELHGS